MEANLNDRRRAGRYTGDADVLRPCYLASLQLAPEHEMNHIAFPCVAAGVYEFPVDLAARIVVEEVKAFRALNPNPQHRDVLLQLPLYSDYGFAVFQLPRHNAREHAMAFEFPRREKEQLFFPTVHIHDGKVGQAAHFDHALYCQVSPRPRGWKASFWHPYDHSRL